MSISVFLFTIQSVHAKRKIGFFKKYFIKIVFQIKKANIPNQFNLKMRFDCMVFVLFAIIAKISCAKFSPPAIAGKLTYPDCIYTEVNFDYNTFTSECSGVCPEKSIGSWPNCTCEDRLTTFNLRM